MALSLGQLLAGAGQVSVGMRRAEEAERVARENQLKIEEQNRLAAMKAQMAQQQYPSLGAVPTAPTQFAPLQFAEVMSQRQIAPPAAPAAPAAPKYYGTAAAEERGFVPPTTPVAPAAPPMGPRLGATFTPSSTLPPDVEQLGVAFEDARTASRAAQAKLRAFGSRQRQARPAEYEAAKLEAMQAQENLRAAQTAYEAAVSPYTRSVQVQPQVPPVSTPAAQPSPVAPQPTVETKVSPQGQAARDKDREATLTQELVYERQRAQSGNARAAANVAAIEREMRLNGITVPPAPDAPAAAAAAAAAPTVPAAAVTEPTATMSPVSQNTANAVLQGTAQMLQTDPTQLSRAIQETQAFATQQRALMAQQRNDAARLAQIYMQSGTTEGITQGRALMQQIGQADLALGQFDKQMRDSIIYMQGIQALQQFGYTNNPAQLQGVWSYFSDAPIGLRPRSDGNYDFYYNGQLGKEGMSKAEVQEAAQIAMFQAARDAIAKSAELKNKLILEARHGPEAAKAMRDILVAVINGQIQLAVERTKQAGGKLTSDGAGNMYYQPPGGGLYALSKAGIVDVPGGAQIPRIIGTEVSVSGR